MTLQKQSGREWLILVELANVDDLLSNEDVIEEVWEELLSFKDIEGNDKENIEEDVSDELLSTEDVEGNDDDDSLEKGADILGLASEEVSNNEEEAKDKSEQDWESFDLLVLDCW